MSLFVKMSEKVVAPGKWSNLLSREVYDDLNNLQFVYTYLHFTDIALPSITLLEVEK